MGTLNKFLIITIMMILTGVGFTMAQVRQIPLEDFFKLSERTKYDR